MNALQLKFMEGSRVVKGISDHIFIVIWITMLTVQSEIQPLLKKLADIYEIFKIILQ